MDSLRKPSRGTRGPLRRLHRTLLKEERIRETCVVGCFT